MNFEDAMPRWPTVHQRAQPRDADLQGQPACRSILLIDTRSLAQFQGSLVRAESIRLIVGSYGSALVRPRLHPDTTLCKPPLPPSLTHPPGRPSRPQLSSLAPPPSRCCSSRLQHCTIPHDLLFSRVGSPFHGACSIPRGKRGHLPTLSAHPILPTLLILMPVTTSAI